MPNKFFRKKSRLALLADNNLGIVEDDDRSQPAIFSGSNTVKADGGSRTLKYRRELLNTYEKYYEGHQYDHLQNWDEACCKDDYVAIRERKPRMNFNFAKTLTSRIASKIVGEKAFPKLKVEDDPDTGEFIREIIKAAKLKSRLIEPVRRMANDGSVFVRFYIRGVALKVEHFCANYCYPVFDDVGELEQLEVRYVYEDTEDKDPTTGKFREKWYRLILAKNADILFDNPYFKEGAIPEFTVVEQVDHNFGFVQGEWFRTDEDRHVPDGYSVIQDILGFIDEVNYSLSQSSQAISYNQDPQLVMNEMDEEELETLIRSSMKAWNLGKNGKAEFLESDLGGVKIAMEARDKVKTGIGEISRVVFVDPEKAVASAQSGKAMEILYGPFVELIDELRPMVEDRIVALIVKMMVALLTLRAQGVTELPVVIPDGYLPKSLSIVASWAPVFPMTIEDLTKKVQAGAAAAAGNLISRESITRWIAADFDIEDVESEVAKIAAQPQLNPFGAF